MIHTRKIFFLFFIFNASFLTWAQAAGWWGGLDYPRPDLRRADWLSMDGTWAFALDPDNRGLKEEWFQNDRRKEMNLTIRVPFPVESELSGVPTPDDASVGWYGHSLQVPAEWRGQRLWLHLGAVSSSCRVWINGQEVLQHQDGYTPLEVDITDALALDALSAWLVVRYEHPGDLRQIPHGKQRSTPPDPYDFVCFARSSGIWRSVWIEPRPVLHMRRLSLRCESTRGPLAGDVTFSEPVKNESVDLELLDPSGERIFSQTLILSSDAHGVAHFSVQPPAMNAWSPLNPALYRVRFTAGEDQVETYFGVRSIRVQDGALWLNEQPLYLRGVLSHGFWPEGLYTAHSPQALEEDVRLARGLGFNMIRMHLKVEDPRFYFAADRLGMLVWQDIPCPGLWSEESSRALASLTLRTADLLNSYPSVIVWSPYNEEWGLDRTLQSDPAKQAFVLDLVKRLRSADPTRLVVDNSGWSHVDTDLADFHYYEPDPQRWENFMRMMITERKGRLDNGACPLFVRPDPQHSPLVCSEMREGRGMRATQYFWERQLNFMRQFEDLCGYVYVELTDYESDQAGLFTAQREPKPWPFDPLELNSPSALLVMNDSWAQAQDPDRPVTAGQAFCLELALSCEQPLPVYPDAWLEWQWLGFDLPPVCQAVRCDPKRPGVHPLGNIKIQAPEVLVDTPSRLQVTLHNSQDTLLAKRTLNYRIKRSPACPAPAPRWLITPGALEPTVWRWTTRDPGEGWASPAYDDSHWQQGFTPFGSGAEPAIEPRGFWNCEQIWLRRRLDFDGEVAAACWKLFYDEEPMVYLNGQRLFELPDWSDHEVCVAWDDTAASILRQGENIVAVTCRQKSGGQMIDLGLQAVIGVAKCSHVSGPVHIDGEFSDWPSRVKWLPLAQTGHCTDENDARVAWSWDEKYLYAAWQVKDANLWAQTGHAPGDTWREDSVEVYVDVNADGGKRPQQGDFQFRLDLARRNGGERGSKDGWQRWEPQAGQWAVALSGSLNNNDDLDEGYCIEIALDWASLGVASPWPGQWIAVATGLTDDDEGSQSAQPWKGWRNVDPQIPDTYYRLCLEELP